jgi:HSP20 family protein
MRRDDRDDPFDEFFREIERMMNDMMGSQGEFRIQTSGGQRGGSAADVHFDVHEGDDEVRVVADLPGVTKQDIALQCDGQSLTVDAAGDQREYHERIQLPRQVDEHSAEATYNNGILEVTFDPGTDATSIDI